MAWSDTVLNVDGVRFLAVSAAEAWLVKTTGVYALVRREADDRRTFLYVDAAECAGPDAQRTRAWREAVKLGMNEMLFTLGVREPETLNALKAQVIAAVQPPLNAGLEQAA